MLKERLQVLGLGGQIDALEMAKGLRVKILFSPWIDFVLALPKGVWAIFGSFSFLIWCLCTRGQNWPRIIIVPAILMALSPAFFFVALIGGMFLGGAHP